MDSEKNKTNENAKKKKKQTYRYREQADDVNTSFLSVAIIVYILHTH